MLMLRNKKIMLLGLAMAGALTACQRESLVSDLWNDKSAGSYALVSATWKGGEVDLNGDGVPSCDILEELEGIEDHGNLSMIVDGPWGGTVSPIQGQESSSVIWLSFPIQRINYSTRETTPRVFRNWVDFVICDFDYTVTNAGSCTVNCEPRFNSGEFPEPVVTPGMQILDYCFTGISQPRRPRVYSIEVAADQIRVEASVPYYDYITDTRYTNPVIFVYDRIKSAAR